MWLRQLIGFKEENPEQVRLNLKLEGEYITSLKNNLKMRAGSLETPTLSELRQRLPKNPAESSKIKFSQISGNVQQLHKDSINKNAVFQAASQFNLLEMVAPHITPEMGIDEYDSDLTQGPACAIACGAGTIFRNYLVDLNTQIGQSKDVQIDCLRDVGLTLQNTNNQYWTMSNGYMLPTPTGLDQINMKFSFLSQAEQEQIFSNLRVGIQRDTEVTISETKHTVSQVYCSAVPINYTQFDHSDWEVFAKLILNASYESTMIAAIENMYRTKSNSLFLTLVGGGVFGNKQDWILEAIELAILKYHNYPLNVKIVSYSVLNQHIEEFINRINKTIANKS
jgi:hypothetical protein